MAATQRIKDFLRSEKPEGPCLIVDLNVVEDNFRAFDRAMPGTRIFYAVKANPAPEILSLLNNLGSCFDTASVEEIKMALAASANHAFRFTLEGKGVPPDLHERIRALQREYNAHHHELPEPLDTARDALED